MKMQDSTGEVAVVTGASRNRAMRRRWSRREKPDAPQPEDVARPLVYAFAQPARVLVEKIVVRPVKRIDP